MTTHNFKKLRSAVIEASQSDNWERAVQEWQVISVEEDPRGTGTCVCGKNPLVYLYIIHNWRTKQTLVPIGSKCVNLFGVEELDLSVDVLHRLLKLRTAYATNRSIALTGDYFSRNVLADLLHNGAFPPNGFNRQSGDNDYKFLLDLFNQRQEITPNEGRKVWVLLNRTIRNFVLNDERLGPLL